MKTLYIICDLFDPSMGSEFNVGTSIMNMLAVADLNEFNYKIITPGRANNQNSVATYLGELKKRHPLLNLSVKFIPFRYANSSGHHKNVFFFLLDLILFYKDAASLIPAGGLVWKCSSVNLFFLIMSSFFLYISIAGPVSGFKKTLPLIVPCVSIKTKIRYCLYSCFIFIQEFLLLILKSTGRLSPKLLLGSTTYDCQSLKRYFPHAKVIHCMETLHDLRNPGSPKVLMNKPHSQMRILWSGSLIARKNPLFAIKLFEKIRKHVNATLTIVGDGPLQTDLRSLVSKSPYQQYISILPSTSRASFLKILEYSDILLVTSFREANSFLVTEAVLKRVFVVAPRLNGFIDSLQNSCGSLYTISSTSCMQEVLDIVISLAEGSFECDFNSTSGILSHYDNVLSEIRTGISELL